MLEAVEDCGDHLLDGNAAHAAEIYGALAPKAWSAGNIAGQELVRGAAFRQSRAGQLWRGASERNNYRSAHGSRQMHRAGIVCEQDAAQPHGGAELAQ